MSVINVHQDKTADVRSSTHTISTSDGKVTRTHTLTFRVETDTIADDSQSVLLSPSVVHMLDVHANDLAARATSVTASQRGENGRLWTVTANYTTDAPTTQDDEDPLNQPRKVSWSSGSVSVVAERDRDGKVIVNSAGDPFDPPIEIERPHAILVVSRNEASFSGTTIIQYKQKVNSAPFSIGGVGEIICSDINATTDEQNGIEFWNVTYKFEYAPEGWQPEILEQGLRQITATGSYETCKDDEGNDVTTPVLLNSAGKQILARDGTSSTFTKWNVYEEIDFNQLGLNV